MAKTLTAENDAQFEALENFVQKFTGALKDMKRREVLVGFPVVARSEPPKIPADRKGSKASQGKRRSGRPQTKSRSKPKVTDRDPGQRRTKRRGSSEPPAAISVFAEHVADIAAINEFGTRDGKIPPRPFLRPGMRMAQRPITEMTFRQIIKGIEKGGDIDTEFILERAGIMGQASVQNYINESMGFAATPPWQPLSPVTIKLKGSEKPLVDTGRMSQSVTYVVRQRTRE